MKETPAAPLARETTDVHVHPPLRTGHSRSDFLFHMLTIAAGLLLAIALEHAVERLHEQSQRRQLVADLREEGVRNRGYVERDVALLDASIAWLERAGAAVHAVRTGRDADYPASWDDEMRRTGRTLGIPTSAVWSTAEATGALRLLPREHAFAFARLYFMHERVTAFDLERRKAVASVRAAERVAANGVGEALVLASASPTRLDELAAAIAKQRAVDAHFRSLLAGYGALNDAVLAGDLSGSVLVGVEPAP